MVLRCYLVTVALLLLSGCQRVYWTEWEYQRIETKPLSQQVKIESEPSAASVQQERRNLGQTPCDITVEYTETAAVFQRQHIEQNGTQKRVLETKVDRRDVTINPTPVVLRFHRPYYWDTQTAFVVPGQQSVSVTLDAVSYDWEIKTTDDVVARSQVARIISVDSMGKPVDGAAVYLDKTQIGVTPFDYEFPYEETELILKRKRIRENSGPSPRIEVETKKEVAGLRERMFELVAKRAEYLDARELVRIPLTGRKIVIALIKATDIYDVECTLRITARENDFPVIREKLEDFAVPNVKGDPEVVAYPMDAPAAATSHVDAFTQSYFLRVKDTDQFEAMVSGLRDLANKEGFLLDFVNARVGAEFNTNDALAGIEHVISGYVRPGSALYHVLRHRVPKRGEKKAVRDDGSYGFRIILAADVHNAYLASIYIPPEPRYNKPLAVFIRVDVHTAKQVEIQQGEFEDATGITFDAALLDKLSPRWPAARIRAFDDMRAQLLQRIQREANDGTAEEAAVRREWTNNIDRNLVSLRRVASERATSESGFPFPSTREWLNTQLRKAGEAAEQDQ